MATDTVDGRLSTWQRWTMLAVILGSGIVFLDTSVVNLALPRIAVELPSRYFGLAPLESQSYIANGYFLTLSALLILGGALNDHFGRRRMFAAGLVGFMVTSVLCGLAPSIELLILFRILQGATGALVVPGSLAIITASFEGEQQGRAFGVWAGASAATTILGPFIGGVLVNSISWRAAFFINVPFLLVALSAMRYVPESRDEASSGRFDWLGSIVVALAVGGLAFGTIRGQQTEWRGTEAFVSLAVGAAATIVFPILMVRSPKPLGRRWLRLSVVAIGVIAAGLGAYRAWSDGLVDGRVALWLSIAGVAAAIWLVIRKGKDHPLVPPGLFRSRNFTVTNLSTFVIYGALYVFLTFQGLFLIGTLGYTEPAAGIAGLPATLFLALFSTRFGRLAARHGPRRYMAIGPLIMAAGLLYLVRFPPTSEPWLLGEGGSILPPIDYFRDLLPALLIFGVGLMVMVAPLTTALMTSVPVQNSGVASAINNAISRVGAPLVTALIFVAVVSTFYDAINQQVPEVNTSSREFREQVAPLNVQKLVVEDGDPGLVDAARRASTESFHLAALVAAGLMLIGAAVNGFGISDHQALAGGRERAVAAPDGGEAVLPSPQPTSVADDPTVERS